MRGSSLHRVVKVLLCIALLVQAACGVEDGKEEKGEEGGEGGEGGSREGN